MTRPALRNRYLSDSITTASPATLLVMLYDRLLLDLTQAEAALGAAPLGAPDRETASARLTHAQDIIIELLSSLRLDVWDGAARLSEVYRYLLTELIAANIQADAGKVASCRALVAPLADAWRQAAASLAQADAAESRPVAAHPAVVQPVAVSAAKVA